VHVVAVAPWLGDIGRSLREAFFMFWETLWALVLGFTLSGVVQAFVSKRQLQARLGDHRPAAVARASGYGMVSSSCSYAASAMSKSLFMKGADFTSAMVFMIASTNLVIELGLVLLVLMGWEFMVAEFVGGPIMIALLALTGGIVFTTPLVLKARARLKERSAQDHHHVSEQRQAELEETPFGKKIHEPAAWADASSYAVADVTMLRKELALGYVVAGFLAVVVPADVWSRVFLQGHGFWTVLENAAVGPLIAVISWVCSIGNVPLAAALWSGGISFGGVIAFIFADLIAMPLILIYAKFYGWKLTMRLVGLFYVLMVIAGLATQGIFHAVGAVPANRTLSVESAHFEWNYTTFLNIVFLVVAAGVWWLAKNRARFGGGAGYGIDPVCGMQVRMIDAPGRATHDGVSYYFCSDKCLERFTSEPNRFIKDRAAHPMGGEDDRSGDGAIDPVCGMSVDPASPAATRRHDGVDYHFCNVSCASRFDADPTLYVDREGPFEATDPGDQPISMSRRPAATKTVAAAIDPICGMSVTPQSAAATRTIDGTEYLFCSTACATRFDAQGHGGPDVPDR